jgi:predicted MFS family arabinose efflux permease
MTAESPAGTALPAARARRRRHPLRNVVLACMLVLLLSQALIGALSLSALNRLTVSNTAERIELLAGRTAAQIQTGMRLGKPLAQYFGLADMLRGLSGHISDLQGASVLLADGQVVESYGGPVDGKALIDALSHDGDTGMAAVRRSPSGAVYSTEGDTLKVAVALDGADGTLAGAMVLQVRRHAARESALMVGNARVLLLTTLGAAIALVLFFRFVIPLYELASANKARLWFPLLVLLLAQGIYAAYTIHAFRDVWMQVTRQNTQILGQGLQRDLDRVLGYGIAPSRLRGVEKPMSRLAASFPVISELRLVDAHGRLLNRADAHGALPVWGASALAGAVARPSDVMAFPLRAKPGGPVLASLQIVPDESIIAAGVRARILDAATVVLAALVVAIELLMLLALLMDRAFSARAGSREGVPVGLDDATNVGAVVRPVMFGFLFALALPLSFLPIYARSLLPGAGSGQDAALLVALPIAAEMACGLLTALLAGRLVDRRGWFVPVVAGLIVSVLGNLACAATGSLVSFTLARGLVGLGYGMAWMGLQGFIVVRSPSAYRGRNMASVVAGIFAGHLSGAAVGAMLMQQLGSAAVFIAGAFLLALPAVGVFTLMWPYRHMHGHAVARAAARPLRESWQALRRLLATRDFGMLLVGCVIPFSIAQVGLLTYALPLYMDAHGASVASVGRTLMLYGLCVIYIGPYMGRMADKSTRKKYWIAAGGLVGSVGLLSMHFASGIAAAAVAVVLLALASCLAGGAQTAYMLALDHVQGYGAGGATSVMRAADKFGQMLGPLVVGGLFASVGISGGLAVTGALYLVATFAFMLFAPRLAH